MTTCTCVRLFKFVLFEYNQCTCTCMLGYFQVAKFL